MRRVGVAFMCLAVGFAAVPPAAVKRGSYGSLGTTISWLTSRLQALNATGHAPTTIELDETVVQAFHRVADKISGSWLSPFPLDDEEDSESGYSQSFQDVLVKNWTFMDIVPRADDATRVGNELAPGMAKLLVAGDPDARQLAAFLQPLKDSGQLYWAYFAAVSAEDGFVHYHCDNCDHNVPYRIPCDLEELKAERRRHRLEVASSHAETTLDPARFHLPLAVQSVLDSVQFILGGQRVTLRQGRIHYVDVAFPHYIVNRASQRRVTLIIDILRKKLLSQSSARALGPHGLGLWQAFDRTRAAPGYAEAVGQAQDYLAEHELSICNARAGESISTGDMLMRENLDRAEVMGGWGTASAREL